MQYVLIDKQDCRLNYLRLSITDRCDLWCYYCMPEEGINFVNREALLSWDEMFLLNSLFTELGISKMRITGGETFVRKRLMPFVTNIIIAKRFTAQLIFFLIPLRGYLQAEL